MKYTFPKSSTRGVRIVNEVDHLMETRHDEVMNPLEKYILQRWENA